MEVELTILKSPLESADELAAKDFAQNFLGKEVVFSCVDPTRVIGREAASVRQPASRLNKPQLTSGDLLQKCPSRRALRRR
jgi:hypothetical protein